MRRCALLCMFVCSVVAAAAGCRSAEWVESAPRPAAPAGASRQARDFLARFDATAPGSAARQRLLEQQRWPHRGPREAQLVEASVRETVLRGSVMFLGVRKVALADSLATEPVRQALGEAAPSAEIARLSEASDAADKSILRISRQPVEYYAGGEVGVVPVVLRRGRPWSVTERLVFVFARDRWVFHGVAEDG